MDIRNIKIISLILVCLLSFNFVFALGVSSPYWKENPLEMNIGETKDISFTLVNREDAETARAFVTMEDDGGVATLTGDSEYSVAPGTTNTKVGLRVSIPSTASIGDFYNVKFSVRSDPEGEGTVQLRLKYDVSFPVIVVEKTTPPTLPPTTAQVSGSDNNLGMVLAIIILIILIIFVLIYLVVKKNQGSLNKKGNKLKK